MMVSTPTSPSVIRYSTTLKYRFVLDKLQLTLLCFPYCDTDRTYEFRIELYRGERSLLRADFLLSRARALGWESTEWREDRSFSDRLYAAEALLKAAEAF
jgi:hypothetical protein